MNKNHLPGPSFSFSISCDRFLFTCMTDVYSLSLFTFDLNLIQYLNACVCHRSAYFTLNDGSGGLLPGPLT